MYINWPFWNRPLLFSSSCYYCLLSSFEKSVKSYPPDPPQFSTSLMSIFCDTPPPVTKLINKMVCNKNWLNSTLSVKFVLFANYRITSSVSGFHYHLPKYIYIQIDIHHWLLCVCLEGGFRSPLNGQYHHSSSVICYGKYM